MSENWARGPWSICGSTSIRDAANRPIATVRSLDPKMDGSHNENRDTANLIAAAPEMHDALQAILPYVPISSASEGGAVARSGNVIAADKVRAALKKARGES